MSDERTLPLENDVPDVAVLLRDLRELITSARERAPVAIIREMETFLLELGARFAFVVCQRLISDYKNYEPRYPQRHC